MEEGVSLKGRIIGFGGEEYELRSPFGKDSPLRLLFSLSTGLSFLVINPYFVMDDYVLDLDDAVLRSLCLERPQDVAVLCIVRPEADTLYVNLRCPLIINTKGGIFAQVILQNEGYPMSFPFAKRLQRKDP